jgi:type I restriction enzyme R subunit
VADARQTGTGRRYLIQHSAGSGKSNSTAWLAHQLSVLHDATDQRVFDSIIVITDRRVLDRQLQRTVLQFEQTLGVVENIDKTSRQLKQALEDGKMIIVTTLQKFPVIVGQMGELSQQRFAVIVDEAHSSQTGESTKSLKAVLMAGSLAQADEEESAEEDDLEDCIFNHVVNDLLQELIDGHFKFYKQVNDDEAFAKVFLDLLFQRYLAGARQLQAPSASTPPP